MIKINAVGLECPMPVIQCRNAIFKNPNTAIEVTVDNKIATENLLKLVEEMGLEASTSFDEKLKHYTFVVQGDGEISRKQEKINEVIVIKSNVLGIGSEELGEALMKSFVYSLNEQDKIPSHIIFYNRGVFVPTKYMHTVRDLQSLESKGVSILICGACLDYYMLNDEIKVGEVTNMYKIVEILGNADKVLYP